MFLLDTDHISVLQAHDEPDYSRLVVRMEKYTPDDFCVSIVSFHEEELGWNAYLSHAREATRIIRAYRMFEEVLSFFTSFPVLSYDQQASDIFHSLRQQKVRIGAMDLRIASIALVGDCAVLTRNLVDFQKVPHLRIEDWTRP